MQHSRLEMGEEKNGENQKKEYINRWKKKRNKHNPKRDILNCLKRMEETLEAPSTLNNASPDASFRNVSSILPANIEADAPLTPLKPPPDTPAPSRFESNGLDNRPSEPLPAVRHLAESEPLERGELSLELDNWANEELSEGTFDNCEASPAAGLWGMANKLLSFILMCFNCEISLKKLSPWAR
jgi:hypothetical protein